MSWYSPGETKEDHWQPLRIVSQTEYLSNISQLAFTCRQICTPISETVFVVCGGYLYYPANMMGYNHVLSFSCILFSSLSIASLFPCSFFLSSSLSWNCSFTLVFLYFYPFHTINSFCYFSHFPFPFIYSPCCHSYLLSNSGRR